MHDLNLTAMLADQVLPMSGRLDARGSVPEILAGRAVERGLPPRRIRASTPCPHMVPGRCRNPRWDGRGPERPTALVLKLMGALSRHYQPSWARSSRTAAPRPERTPDHRAPAATELSSGAHSDVHLCPYSTTRPAGMRKGSGGGSRVSGHQDEEARHPGRHLPTRRQAQRASRQNERGRHDVELPS